ncbi:MAG TPA: hypothetical protein VIM19_03915 [Actinomycetes bacterium]
MARPGGRVNNQHRWKGGNKVLSFIVLMAFLGVAGFRFTQSNYPVVEAIVISTTGLVIAEGLLGH